MSEWDSLPAERVDVVVVGAGAIGLAVARALARAGREVLVLERAGEIGTETSSRNSEVIHAGIYYPTGSLKATLCVRGKQLLYRFCRDYGVAHENIGKVIVGTSEAQRDTLSGYREQARANEVGELRWLSAADLRVLEPAVAGVCGLWSETTGIIDSHAYMLALQGDLEANGGMIAFHTEVLGGRVDADGPEVVVAAGGADGEAMKLRPRLLVIANGLSAPALVAGFEGMPQQHVPGSWYAIGHYYSYSGRSPFNHLVYPVAEAGGLGVHVTLDIGHQARFGPDVRWIDAIDYAFDESRRGDFESAIRAYYPDLDTARLQPGYTGIRPKISGPGEPAADFVLQDQSVHGVPGLINLFGIESPGLTASLAIAQWCADRAPEDR